MSIMRRMSDLFQQKANKVLDRAEDPVDALDLSYQKQLEALQQVKRSVAEVLTSEKRLEMQAAQLQQTSDKSQTQAKLALQQGREDLARLALTRAQQAQAQLDGMQAQIQQLKDQEQKLEVTAQKLTAKVESFRTQRETIKAQYSAAKASTQIGEAVTGLSEQMTDVNLMMERAQDKTQQMQARSAAIDSLVDSGTLDTIGISSGDDIDRQLQGQLTDSQVDAQLAAMKQEVLASPDAAARITAAPAPALPDATPTSPPTSDTPDDQNVVVRISGEDQYRLNIAERPQLDPLDAALSQAIESQDQAAYAKALSDLLNFVRAHGSKLPPDSLLPSDVVLPSEDMTLEEATKLLSDGGTVVEAGAQAGS
ncbi:MAG TPA: PspA/IM30 family protein [Candidatus Dormibacteraeota bacterium]|nr:PspA/IM30 family protein [Candidatus Dormibacteraeota bacterium]